MNVRLAGGLPSVALSLCLSIAVSAQTPTVVTNLPQPTNQGAIGYQFAAVDDAIYFYADPPDDHAGIWKWTEADGPQRMTIVAQESFNFVVPSMMAYGDKLLFSNRVFSAEGYELWISNGTAAGTALLKDIHPSGSSSPVLEVVSNGKAYFTALHPEYGRELWVTDGTAAGTTLVKDLTGDSRSSSPTGFVERNGLVYFTNAGQLWVTDGTDSGTISLATGVNASKPGVLAGEVVFLGGDETNGRELWSTDGTPAGTALVKDMQPGAASSWGGLGTPFAPVGTSLLFFGEDTAHGRELWRTDGTAAGTELVKDITPGEDSTSLERLLASDAGAFFLVNGTTLWFSDGTEAGTIPVESFANTPRMVTAPNGAYLTVYDPDVAAPTLVYSDGTVDGTNVIPDVKPDLMVLVSTGGHVLFNAPDGTAGWHPWITDGTAAGTQVLTRIPISVTFSPPWMRAAGSYAYFSMGSTLYRSDGTAAGTFPLATALNTNYYSSMAVPLGDLFLFQAVADGKRGLWRSDGTVAGTTLVKELEVEWIFPTTGGYALMRVYQSGSKLWRTDGSEAGTYSLVSASPQSAVEVAGKVYFFTEGSYETQHRKRLWETGGTAETTRVIATGEFSRLGTAGGILYFVQATGAHGFELWKSDGTADGSTLVKDIFPGALSSSPDMFSAAGNTLVFLASTSAYGRELWRSDGTEGGTYLLRDVSPGGSSPNIVSMVPSGRYLYFVVDEGSGRSLWRTDGTIAGTILLAETTHIATPPVAVDGKLVFTAHVAPYGSELWESDGTPAGTFVVADLIPGNGSSHPGPYGVTSDLLFFSTADGKLWKRERAASRLSITDRRVTEGDAGTTILQFTVTRQGSTAGAASVGYATVDITATAGQDYEAASGTVSFAAGETSKQIAIAILSDVVSEQNESFGVTLSGATGATLIDPSAFGIIDDNDRRVALSIEYVPRATGADQSRVFRIKNDGASLATVTLRVSESPYDSTFTCDGKNPSVCQVGAIPAGETREVRVSRGFSHYDKARRGRDSLPGRTLTATVSAAEAEDDLSDNTVARMISSDSAVSLPPYLIAGSNATARMAGPQYSTGSSTVELALTGGVLVSPGTATVSPADPVATFDLTVAPNAWGWSSVLVSRSIQPWFRIPILLPGEPVRLETTIVPPYESSTQVSLGTPVSLPVTIAAVLHDGTRPSGTVSLVRSADESVVQTLALDRDAKATFTLNDLARGLHLFDIVYSGDDFFHPLVYALGELSVAGRATSTNVDVHQSPCGVSQIVVTVKNTDGHTPTGTVDIASSWSSGLYYPGVPLVASATAGEATATVSHSFSGTSYISVEARYPPTGTFEGSGDAAYLYPTACPAPTLIASAASATSVSLIWSNVGAHVYDVLRAEGPSSGTYALVGSTGATSFTDTSAQPGRSYLYKVAAKNSAGVVRSTSLSDLATTVIFSDDPIVFRSTRTKAAHILELRQAANALRGLTGQAPLTFPVIGVGMPIKASDITELRTAINNALIAAGRPSVTWVDGVATGKPVKTMHIQQMRNVVK